MEKVVYRKININGLDIHYREAGPKKGPAILLLHGFPSSGHMFRDLPPLLADRFRLVAPDLPGFGRSNMPSAKDYAYTFANIAQTMSVFADGVCLDTFALYIFDNGTPIGLRMGLSEHKAHHGDHQSKRQCVRGRLQRWMASRSRVLGRSKCGASRCLETHPFSRCRIPPIYPGRVQYRIGCARRIFP